MSEVTYLGKNKAYGFDDYKLPNGKTVSLGASLQSIGGHTTMKGLVLKYKNGGEIRFSDGQMIPNPESKFPSASETAADALAIINSRYFKQTFSKDSVPSEASIQEVARQLDRFVQTDLSSGGSQSPMAPLPGARAEPH